MEIGDTPRLPAHECALGVEPLRTHAPAGRRTWDAQPQNAPTYEQVAAIGTEKSQATDYELSQASAAGDMAAFETLYERHSRRVYSLCLRMTQNVAEAEDLAQEVFIQLYRKIGSFRGESAFTTLLPRLNF